MNSRRARQSSGKRPRRSPAFAPSPVFLLSSLSRATFRILRRIDRMNTEVDLSNILHSTLRERFGFDSFRSGQEYAISRLLDCGRLVCIQPTGYGKSLLYQLPAVLTDGLTLVVSPLLALVRDQVKQLNERFQIPAGAINSDQSDEENADAAVAAADAKLKVLFIAPEQLDNLERLEFLKMLSVDLLVIDEAHCISTWGHDFRPAYRQIIKLVRIFEKRTIALRVLALTATADEATERDIVRQLADAGTVEPEVIRNSMKRDNISLFVRQAKGLPHKLDTLVSILKSVAQPAVVYCATRENVETVTAFLEQRVDGENLRAVPYHAGFDERVKRDVQTRFFAGKISLIVATNALGMGIDKSDIRTIIHFDVPSSVTAYYQEVGRAGRDGHPSKGILIYDNDDRKIQEHFIRSAQPSQEDFLTIYSAIADTDPSPTITEIKSKSGLHPTLVTVCLAELSEQNVVTKVADGRRQVYRVRAPGPMSVDTSRYDIQRRKRERELNLISAYGRSECECRMSFLRSQLGDESDDRCGVCDRCDEGTLTVSCFGNPNTEEWLASRLVPIEATKYPVVISEGFCILDGTLKLSDFRIFMKARSVPEAKPFTEKFEELIIAKIAVKLRGYEKAAIVPIPSLTWAHRAVSARLFARASNCSIVDCLDWEKKPVQRQGELLNNDQRKANVQNKMHATRDLGDISTVLLLDDYWGSGNTMKEAARALRKTGGFKGEIVPVAFARVKWKLGQPGMI